jgi:Kef-type K+ transport system membrane component KefB/glycine cleavage system regulatory protein
VIVAVTEGVDLGRILLDLLIVLAAARLAAEAAERFNIPAVLGEIAAGVAIGPSALGLLRIEGDRGVSVAVLAELGVLLLLVQVGMEMDLIELRKVGRASLLVALVGVALPFVGGAVAGLSLGHDAKTAIFLGAALTATSVGITARVFGDLHALATTEARVVIGAAVADDVFGLVILTVVVKVVSRGTVGVGVVTGTLGLAMLFLVVTGVVGLFIMPRLLDAVHRFASSGATVVIAAIVLMLAFAELADLAKLAFIIGAFVAGLSISRSAHHERIAADLGSIGNIFIPIFFVQIGVNADLAAMARPSVLALAAMLCLVGVLGKVAAGWAALGIRADKFLIGLGMIPRGEVGLIFASIGLSNGVLDKNLYGALLVVVLVTTVATPPLLRQRLGSSGGRARSAMLDEGGNAQEPVGGWLIVIHDEIHFAAPPPVAHTSAIALKTALLLDEAVPSDELLDWFGRHRGTPIDWDPADTPTLVAVLRRADTKIWRFLEVTGVLDRTLPEVAVAMRRRRSDIRDLDPLSSLRFPTVEALRDLPSNGIEHDDDLVLASLAADVCADSTRDNQCVVELTARLGRSPEANRVVDLVADARLLRASATHSASFEEPALLQLATHLASPVHAREAFTLALAMSDLTRRQRDSMTELYERIADVLDHPEFGGREAGNLAGSRLAQHVAVSPAVAERLQHSSIAYLLSHDPEELARQARLVEPLPRSGVVRVTVSPDPEPDVWNIDVACRDAPGLLVRLASVLATHELAVRSASIETWPDGAVVDSFSVHSTTRPSAKQLAQAMEHVLTARLPARPMSGLQLSFDDDSMPWHTVCTVTGPDQPGTLEAVTAAFAAADVLVHTARVATIDGQVADRFTVSDRVGRKLDLAAEERVLKALAGETRHKTLRSLRGGRRRHRQAVPDS